MAEEREKRGREGVTLGLPRQFINCPLEYQTFLANKSLYFWLILVTLGLLKGAATMAEMGWFLGLVNSWFTAKKNGHLMCDNKPLVHVFIFLF